jgi:hypothetical protein
MHLIAIFDELEKLGAVSHDEAGRALDRLETLERNKPTAPQVARYGAIGAGTGAAVGLLKSRIKGTSAGGVRGLAADAVGGALATGAIPLLRSQMDRKAEAGTLQRYLHEQTMQPAEIQKVAALRFRFKLASMMLPPPTAMAKAIGGGGNALAHLPGAAGASLKAPAVAANSARAHNAYITGAKKLHADPTARYGIEGLSRDHVPTPSQLPAMLPTMPPKAMAPRGNVAPAPVAAPGRPRYVEAATGAPPAPAKPRYAAPAETVAPTAPSPSSAATFPKMPTMAAPRVPQF